MAPGSSPEDTRPRPGEPLDKRGLFQLVADEAFRDGVVEEVENRLLQVLTRFLRLPQEEVVVLARSSKQRFRRGQLGAARPLEPGVLYREVLLMALSDGELQPLEGDMLAGLRWLLGIPEEEHKIWVTGLLQGGPEGLTQASPEEAAPCPASLQAMVGEAASLAEVALRQPLAVEDLAQLEELLPELERGYQSGGLARTQAFLALANLAAVFPVEGRMHELEALLLRLLDLDPRPFRQQMLFQTLLVNALKGEQVNHTRAFEGACRHLVERLDEHGGLGKLGTAALAALVPTSGETG